MRTMVHSNGFLGEMRPRQKRMMNEYRAIPFFLALFVPWVLTSCAGRLSATTVAPNKTVAQSERESLVFGRIIFVENNMEKVPYSDSLVQRPAVTIIIEKGSQETAALSTEKDGSFYWIVPMGSYIVCYISYNNYYVDPQISFLVPSRPGMAFYLGTLRINADMIIPYTEEVERVEILLEEEIEILDEFDLAKHALINRNPDLISDKIEKNLMDMIPGGYPSVSSEAYSCETRHGKGTAGGQIPFLLFPFPSSFRGWNFPVWTVPSWK